MLDKGTILCVCCPVVFSFVCCFVTSFKFSLIHAFDSSVFIDELLHLLFVYIICVYYAVFFTYPFVLSCLFILKDREFANTWCLCGCQLLSIVIGLITGLCSVYLASFVVFGFSPLLQLSIYLSVTKPLKWI